MGLNKPTFKVNVSASKKSTARKTVFYDLKPDTTTRMRVLPPTNEDGLLFTKVTNHFKLKNEEGFGMALACLDEHGTPETGTRCWLCDLQEALSDSDDKSVKLIGDGLKCNPRWYIQAFIYDKDEDEYFGPKLVGVSKTTADTLLDLLVTQDTAGDDQYCDPENGQDVVITRRGSGLATKYTVMLAGKKSNLDDLVPDWQEKILTDVLGAIDLKMEDVDGQKRAARRSYGDELDWASIEEHVG